MQGGTPSLVPKRRVRELRSLAREPALREQQGLAVLEGVRLVSEVLERGARVPEVYLSPELYSAFANPTRGSHGLSIEAGKLAQVLFSRGSMPAGGLDPSFYRDPSLDQGASRVPMVFQLDADSIQRIATSQHPQGALALVSVPSNQELPQGIDFALGVHGVQDPGNLGTIARSAAAFGAGLLVVSNCADWRHPRALRASAGSLVSLPVVREDDPGALQGLFCRLREAGFKLLGAVAHGGRSLADFDLSNPLVVFLGSEAFGLPDWMLGQMNDLVTIETSGSVESLNVAMAATVLCFEVFEKRSRKAAQAMAKAAS